MSGKNLQRSNETWIKGLDSLRFVLAFIVFLSHLNFPVHASWGHSPHLVLRVIAMLTDILFNGVGAVMAFFIVSGFVIHYPYRDRFPETRSFLVRRWLRIGIPLLVISLIATIFYEFSAIPIWSIYCELIYYTLYPVLIRIKLSWVQKFWISFISSGVLIGLYAMRTGDWSSIIHQRNIQYNGAYWQMGDLLTWIIGLPCWLLGVILAQNIDSYKQTISNFYAYSFRFIVLIASMALRVLKFHFFLSYLFSMNFFAILLFFWIRTEILYFKNRQASRLLEFSGKFSYSLYLCHNVAAYFITLFLPLNVYTYFPTIGLTLLSSYLFYLLVERPSHLLSREAAREVQRRRLAIQSK